MLTPLELNILEKEPLFPLFTKLHSKKSFLPAHYKKTVGGVFMKKIYTEEQLRNTAQECQEFEHIISAMGYGYSLLNVAPDTLIRRCGDCVYWFDGNCHIFQSKLPSVKSKI